MWCFFYAISGPRSRHNILWKMGNLCVSKHRFGTFHCLRCFCQCLSEIELVLALLKKLCFSSQKIAQAPSAYPHFDRKTSEQCQIGFRWHPRNGFSFWMPFRTEDWEVQMLCSFTEKLNVCPTLLSRRRMSYLRYRLKRSADSKWFFRFSLLLFRLANWQFEEGYLWNEGTCYLTTQFYTPYLQHNSASIFRIDSIRFIWFPNSLKLENIKKNFVRCHLHNLYFKEYVQEWRRMEVGEREGEGERNGKSEKERARGREKV